MSLPESILKLSNSFSSLPGIGPKMSHRVALYLALKEKNLAKNISDGLREVIENIRECNRCHNASEEDLCYVCKAQNRDQYTIMVVEDALDLEAIDSAGDYKGLYHVLNGVISPA